jgi:hypothetical protein
MLLRRTLISWLDQSHACLYSITLTLVPLFRMDEAIATRSQKLSPSRYREPPKDDGIKEDITDPPDDYEDDDDDDEEDDNEPPSLSRQKWATNNHRQGESEFTEAKTGIVNPRTAYYGDDDEEDDLAGPQKIASVASSQGGRSYETEDQPESQTGILYNDDEFHVAQEKTQYARKEQSYHEPSPMNADQTVGSKRSESESVQKMTAAKSGQYPSDDFHFGGNNDELMQNDYDDEAYDPRQAEEDDPSSVDYYRNVPNLMNELGYVQQTRLVNGDHSYRGEDLRRRPREQENGFIPVRGDAAVGVQDQRLRQTAMDPHQQRGIGTESHSPTSEYTHSSAMRGAQELLKKNRQKRHQM